jgi:hypothetical protein
VQNAFGPLLVPTPSLTFEGVNNRNGLTPPDTEGDVGPNDYVQWVNVSFQIFDKSGTTLYGPASGNTLWSGFGGPCEQSNAGDPIALYDSIADRWFMSQPAWTNFNIGPYYQCIAISQTPDPTGAYYRYAFVISNTDLGDYPKFGVWPDAYYMSANLLRNGTQFDGTAAFAFDRTRMLSGLPATFQEFVPNPIYWGLLPSDLDGPTLPPAGSPNFFGGAIIGSIDRYRIWKFHVDWNDPANSSFTGPTEVQIAPFNPLCWNIPPCIPQPGTGQGLDPIWIFPMYRQPYRNMGDHEVLLVNHSVDVSANGTNHAGIRWYEIRDPNGTPFVYQQGSYAPDANNRWMGSIAMDRAGDIALGYTVSSSSVYPSVRYTGRLASDPPGTMGSEASIIDGTGSQTLYSGRWGDYSMMTIDPSDDCTFWYTNEYYQTTSPMAWHTRIGSYRFPECLASSTSTPTPTGTPPSATPTRTSTATGTATQVVCDMPGAWQAGPSQLPDRAYAQGSVADDGKLYALGGIAPPNYTPTTFSSRFNPTSNQWETVAHLPVAVFLPAGSAYTGKVYVAGGATAGAVTSTLQIYDIAANSWTFGHPLPAIVEAAGGAALNGKLYIMGGDNGTNVYTSTYIYDITTNTWSMGAPVPAPVTNTSATVANGRIYLFGGVDAAYNAVDTLYAYNPSNNSWTTLAPANTGGYGNLGNISPYGQGKLIAIAGGNTLQQPTNATYLYDILSGTWSSGPHLLTARSGAVQGTLPDGRVLVYGGDLWRGSSETLLAPVPCASPTATVPRTRTATAVATVSNTPLASATPTATTSISTVTPTTCTIQFSDVPVGSTFYPYIRCLACLGIINGYPDGTFRPNNQVTRGQLSKIVSNSAGFSDPQTTQMFQDVPLGSTFQVYVGRLASRGYISGYPCGGSDEPCIPPDNLPYFRPNNNATRGQISKIVSNAAGFNDPPSGQQFEDVPMASTYYTYTFRLVSRGVMSGYQCGGVGEPCIPPANLPYFRPNNNATRGQTSKIVANTFFPDCRTP